jgi:uncharacterized protein
MSTEHSYTAFIGERRLASGPLPSLLPRAKSWLSAAEAEPLLFFDDETGRQVDFDLNGSLEEVLARVLPPPAPAKPGRPRLGVTGREVSLLPRHWEWLEAQPNGISAALRRLVDEARQREPGKQRARGLREAASRFMTAMAGDRPHYEEASRALFAVDVARFTKLVRAWPADIEKHVLHWVHEAERLELADAEAAVETEKASEPHGVL